MDMTLQVSDGDVQCDVGLQYNVIPKASKQEDDKGWFAPRRAGRPHFAGSCLLQNFARCRKRNHPKLQRTPHHQPRRPSGCEASLFRPRDAGSNPRRDTSFSEISPKRAEFAFALSDAFFRLPFLCHVSIWTYRLHNAHVRHTCGLRGRYRTSAPKAWGLDGYDVVSKIRAYASFVFLR